MIEEYTALRNHPDADTQLLLQTSILVVIYSGNV